MKANNDCFRSLTYPIAPLWSGVLRFLACLALFAWPISLGSMDTNHTNDTAPKPECFYFDDLTSGTQFQAGGKFTTGGQELSIDNVCLVGFEQSAQPGDVNQDGRITETDASLTLDIGLKLSQPGASILAAADTSLDGQVTVLDAVLTERAARGLAPLPTRAVTPYSVPTPCVIRVGSAIVQPGDTVTVPVEVANLTHPLLGASFTVYWDATLLRLQEAKVATHPIPIPIPPALNRSDVANGILGFALVSLGDATNTPVGHQLLNLTFQAARGIAPVSAAIKLGDGMAVAEVVGLIPENDMRPLPLRLETGVIAIGRAFAPPVLTRYPANRMIAAGDYANFGVAAVGEAVRYQWYKDDLPLIGQTDFYIEMHDVQMNQAGLYYAVVANPAGSVVSPKAALLMRPNDCVEFETLPLGTAPPIGSRFVSETLAIDVLPAIYDPTNGFARIEHGLKSSGTGHEMHLESAILNFHFPYLLGGVGVRFFESKGGISLTLNGDARNTLHFRDLDGQAVGGVLVQVSQEPAQNQGLLYLAGKINTLAVGGRALYLDSVCWSRLSSGPLPAATFDDLPEGISYEPGIQFHSYDGRFTVRPATAPDGAIVAGGKATVVGPASPSGFLDFYSRELALSNAMVTIDFGQPLLGLTLDFAIPDDFWCNLEVNGTAWRSGPISELDGKTVAKVTVSILETTPDLGTNNLWHRGTLRFAGPIQTLAIGGHYMDLDNVTPFVVPCIRGDVDGDGRITLQDAQQTLRLATGVDLWDSDLLCEADVSGNDAFDVADAVRIARAAQGIETIPDSPIADLPVPMPDFLRVADAVVGPGKIIEMPVELVHPSSSTLLGLGFTLRWNKELLSFLSAQVGDLPGPIPLPPVLNLDQVAEGMLGFGLGVPGPASPYSTGTNTVLRIRFQAKPGLTNNADAAIWFGDGFAKRQAVAEENGQVGLVRFLDNSCNVAIAAPKDRPTITHQSAYQTGRVGDTLELSVAVRGEDLTYQWYKNYQALPGQTGPILRLENLASVQAGTYEVAVSNPYGTRWSKEIQVQLTTSVAGCVDFEDLPAHVYGASQSFTSAGATMTGSSGWTFVMPFGFTGLSGNSALIGTIGLSSLSFNFGQSPSSLTLAYAVRDWTEFFLAINGSTSQQNSPASLALVALNGQTLGGVKVTVIQTSSGYSGLMTGYVELQGTINSFAIGGVSVFIDDICPIFSSAPKPPVITMQPQDQIVPVNAQSEFQVSATGDAPLNYRWSKDGIDLPGRTADTLSIPAAQFGDIGVYRVVVSNSAGSATSEPAVLIVYTGSCPEYDYEDLPLSHVYTFGQTFVSSGLTNGVGLFYQSGVSGAVQGTVTVQDAHLAGGAGQEIFANNATVFFEFERVLSCLSLRFGQSGGNANLKLNGVLKNVADMTELNGQMVGKVNIKVTKDPATGHGRLYLVGPIGWIGLGGQELAIDDLCVGIAPMPPPGCVYFEDLPANQMYVFGDKFVDSGVKLAVEAYQAVAGTPIYAGNTTVQTGSHAGGTHQEMRTRVAMLGFDFGQTWPGVTLLYGESVGPIDLRVGNEVKVVPDIGLLNNQTVDGVLVTIGPGAKADQGVLTLNGPVRTFGLGGEHLYIDNVCPLESLLAKLSFASSPTISAITTHSADIKWQSSQDAEGIVRYGYAPGRYVAEKRTGRLEKQNTLTLADLEPGSTYHVVVELSAPNYTSCTSREFVFQTQALPDAANPAVSFLIQPEDYSGIVQIPVEGIDNTGIDRVHFYLDGEQLLISYSPPYHLELDTIRFANGRHTLAAKAFDYAGGSSEATKIITFKNLLDASAPTVTISYPTQGASLSGKATVDASFSDDTGLLAAYFYIDGVYTEFLPFPTKPLTATGQFTVDTTQLSNGNHRIGIVVYDKDIKSGTKTVDFTVINASTLAQPDLIITKHEVARHQNAFLVTLEVQNIGSATAANVVIEDFIRPFQAFSRTDLIHGPATYTAQFIPSSGWGECVIESTLDIAPKGTSGDTRTFSYSLVPVLIYPSAPSPSIGDPVRLWYDGPGGKSYFKSSTALVPSTTDGKTLQTAFNDALKEADYLLLTNPQLLYYRNLSMLGDVDTLLSDMATLAVYETGVLGYVYTTSNTAIRSLIEPGGIWATQLKSGFSSKPEKGCLLIVGETEIVPAWDIPQPGTGPIHHSDQPYSDTYGNDDRPELVVGRIVGNTAKDLSHAIQTSLRIYERAAGYGLDRSNALSLSGGPGDQDVWAGDAKKIANVLDDQFTVDTLIFKDYNSASIMLAQLKSRVKDKDVLYYSGHGHVDTWEGVIDTSQFPLDFGSANPLVFASSCRTANYDPSPSDYGISEAFFDSGASIYIGSTVVYDDNSDPDQLFFKNWVNTTKSIGQAFAETEIALINSYGTKYRNWVREFNLYGDPKLGESPAAAFRSMNAQAPENVASAIDVVVPDYIVTSVDGFDHVEIPGGLSLNEEAKPRVPFYTVTLEYPSGYGIQDVQLTNRAGLTTIANLNLPLVRRVERNNTRQDLDVLTDPNDYPQEEYAWRCFKNADGTSTLVITMYPFIYNPGTREAKFYRHFGFAIDYIVPTASISRLNTDKLEYDPNESVVVDFMLSGAGEARNLIVNAVIRSYSTHEIVDGLRSRTLQGLTGPVSFSTQWDTRGVLPGYYYIDATIEDFNGNTLDRQTKLLSLGNLASPIQISAISLTAPEGPISLKFSGLAGRRYTIEESFDLRNWSARASLTAGPDGTFEWSGAAVPGKSAAFYRLRIP